MSLTTAGAIRFQEAYMPRVWGGRRLHSRFGKPLPPGNFGEAWLISDHPVHESLVAEGSLQGRSLNSLLQEDLAYLLGTDARPDRHGRFPLLLKLLDAEQNLSMQVHPDDACALELGEKDGGKTEMWYVLDAERDSLLYCDLKEKSAKSDFLNPKSSETIITLTNQFLAQAGMALLVPAGQVHAIGAGIMLAEIQQNSDVTYRIFDWNRSESDGKPRELHLEKAMKAIRVSDTPPVVHQAQELNQSGENKYSIETLGACPFFTTERIILNENSAFNTKGQSPHILLAISAKLDVATSHNSLTLHPGEAALIPAGLGEYSLAGNGDALRFWVPQH